MNASIRSRLQIIEDEVSVESGGHSLAHSRTKNTLPIQAVLKEFAQPEYCAPQTLNGELIRRLTLLECDLTTAKDPIRLSHGHLEVYLRTQPPVPLETLSAEIYQRTFDLGIRRVTCAVATNTTIERSKRLNERRTDSPGPEAMLLAIKAALKEQQC